MVCIYIHAWCSCELFNKTYIYLRGFVINLVCPFIKKIYTCTIEKSSAGIPLDISKTVFIGYPHLANVHFLGQQMLIVTRRHNTYFIKNKIACLLQLHKLNGRVVQM